MIKKKGNRQ